MKSGRGYWVQTVMLLTVVLVAVVTQPLAASDELTINARLERAMLGEHRSEENRERNRYRHPIGTLEFLGLEDGMRVLEIWPGGGWYSEVLAPALRGHGSYVAASWDQSVEGQPDYRYRLHQALLEKFAARPDLYDQAEVVAWSPPQSASLGEEGSYDMVLTFRNAHGWVEEGMASEVFAEFARVLKPGGILGVVQHRAADGSDAAVTAPQGYVSEQTIVQLANAAGLQLEARSEVNANPADTRNHPEGVWSLPPGYAVCSAMEDSDAKAECEQVYRAIGESDRMTLRFRKPAA